MRQQNKSSYPRSTQKRVPKKARNRQKPNYLLLFYVFMISMAISSGTAYVFRTSDLVINHVKVTGIKMADKKMAVHIGNRALGKHILLVAKSGIVKDIAGLPEVKSVTMGRSFPNGVWIDVKERKPDAVVHDGRNYAMVQFDGYVIHKVSSPIKNCPLIVLPRTDRLVPGQYMRSAAARYGLAAMKCACEDKLKVCRLSIDQDGDMCLNINDGFYVKLGQPDQIATKITILRRTLSYRPNLARDAQYVDVSCPVAPVWKPKESMRAAL